MGIDGRALLAILGMALATYATRAGGLWLMARLPPSPAVARWLHQVPGATLAAIVAPAALAEGAPGVAAAAVALAVATRTGKLPPAMALGLGAALAVGTIA